MSRAISDFQFFHELRKEKSKEKIKSAGCLYCINDKERKGQTHAEAIKNSQYHIALLQLVDNRIFLCNRHFIIESCYLEAAAKE